jgi:hypothetical protein
MKYLVIGFLLLSLAIYSVADATLLVKNTEELPRGYQDNIWEYHYGRVVDVAFPKQDGQTITNLTFAPVGTYATFTEQLPLCGDQEKLLDFNRGDIVIIAMSKRMTRRYCHELLRIDVITGERSAGGGNPFK